MKCEKCNKPIRIRDDFPISVPDKEGYILEHICKVVKGISNYDIDKNKPFIDRNNDCKYYHAKYWNNKSEIEQAVMYLGW